MRIASLALLLIATLFTGTTYADSSDERDFLKKVQVQLAELQLMIKAAEDAVDPDERIRFRYDWLRRDLAIVRRGIQAHIDAQYLGQSEETKLRGDYRQ